MNDFLAGKKSHSPSASAATIAAPRVPSGQSALPRIGTSPAAQSAPVPVAVAPVANGAVPALPACPTGKPVVDVVQTNGRVTQIVVTCGCGEKITLDCLY